MKKILFLALSVLWHTTVPAQNNALTIYDIIKLFAIDYTNPSEAANWQTGAKSSIKWLTPLPKKNPIGYIKSGTLMAAMQNETPCSIDLTGANLAGYTEISLTIKPPLTKTGDYTYDAAALFGRMAPQAKLLKKDDGGFPMYNYQLSIPGKKPLWLIILLDTGHANADEDAATVNIICLTNKVEFDKRTAY